MRFFPNPERIAQLASDERVRKAAEAILQYANRDVLLVLLYGWAILLSMCFSMIYTVRLAASLPVWSQ